MFAKGTAIVHVQAADQKVSHQPPLLTVDWYGFLKVFEVESRVAFVSPAVSQHRSEPFELQFITNLADADMSRIRPDSSVESNQISQYIITRVGADP